MIIAIWRTLEGVAWRDAVASTVVGASVALAASARSNALRRAGLVNTAGIVALNFHQIGFFRCQRTIDVGNSFIRQFLNLFFRSMCFVIRNFFVFH